MKNFKVCLKKTKIIPYIMIGHKGLNFSMRQYDYYVSKGCKIIELGVPFSDPSADGSTIQNASKNALKHSITLYECLDFIEKCKKKTPNIKLILMSYLNPIYTYGLAEFFRNKFVDGVIMPDLPYEEYELIKSYLINSSIAFIPLVALDTCHNRFDKITSLGSGFIYLMSVKGITGSKNAHLNSLVRQIETLKKISDLPIITGFGIKSRDQIREILKHGDGVIMASQLINFWEKEDMDSLNHIFDKQ